MTSLYQEARAALTEFGFRPKKSLGQHFLVHERVLDAMVRLLDLTTGDEVLEVGPGLGFLTRRLLEKASRVYAVEVDPALIAWMQRAGLADDPRLRLIHGDILETRLETILPPRPIKLAANLPYSISTPALFRLLAGYRQFTTWVLMLQKEVADRIASGPGTKAYGTLSVWCQMHARVVGRMKVSPEAFFPRPKVHSTVLKLELYPEPLVGREHLETLRGLMRAAFGHRRKTLAGNLANWLKRERPEIEAFLAGCGVDPRRRGETLSLDEFIRVAHALNRR